MLLVATYWRTNLTMCQIAALFGTSKSATDRIIDDLAPKLALRPRLRYAPGTVLIVDGTLAPTRDHAVDHATRTATVITDGGYPGTRAVIRNG